MMAIRDNLSGGVSKCQQISGLSVITGFSTAGTVKLSWTNPTDPKFKGVRIVYKTDDYPTNPWDGSFFYDSNDTVPVSAVTQSFFVDGTKYYFRAFAYTYKNATRLYTTTTAGAQAYAIPVQAKGDVIFTNSGNFTIPFGVTTIDVFLVGGGAGSSTEYDEGYGGAGGGYTLTEKSFAVTPGDTASVLVGAGGVGGTDGSPSTFTIASKTLTANGGKVCKKAVGGAGGSGGGGGGQYQIVAGNGGSDGSDGFASTPYNNGTQAFTYEGGLGQKSTTRAFGESGGTLYAGGGGGSWSPTGYPGSRGFGGAGGGGNGYEYNSTVNLATGGTPNTGGGAGGSDGMKYANDGGSGIVIVRWGY